MRIPLSTPEDIGAVVRATRLAEGLRQDDAAGAIGVSDVFLWKLEKGSPGIRLDKLLQVLQGLGIQLSAELGEEALRRYEELVAKRAAAHGDAPRKAQP